MIINDLILTLVFSVQATKIWKLFLISKFYFINSFCFIGNLESVVDTMAYNPHNFAFRIGQNLGVSLLESGKTVVVEEIRDELCAFKPKRMEAVAMPPMPDTQRELQLIEIELGNI